jgi:hypothetical protein
VQRAGRLGRGPGAPGLVVGELPHRPILQQLNPTHLLQRRVAERIEQRHGIEEDVLLVVGGFQQARRAPHCAATHVGVDLHVYDGAIVEAVARRTR